MSFDDRGPDGIGDAHRRSDAPATVVADARQHGGSRWRTDAGALPASDRGRDAPSGQRFEGELERVDDFVVAIRTADGGRRAFRTTEGTRVDVKDPLVAHRELLPTYHRRGDSQPDRFPGDAQMSATSGCVSPGSRLHRCCVAQETGLNPADILKPLGESWPTYSGDYSGRRYSSLTQVNQSNVKNLTLAWTATADGGTRGGRSRRRRSVRAA